ncbi:hypothetical protein [Caballeronia sp. BR00000012568055]|uniref:hypothetical protein n=1 Tax=Caballeronia sp. BR00000012568055 TaxID=2918761 RepID=UPI0023F7291A|nr:hypothetical protein [Caballeronia sp. BR00000012568055]
MFQTMEGNARPHRTEGFEGEQHESQADLMRALQVASDAVMRLAGRVGGDPDAMRSHHDAIELKRQHAIADALIARLLAMPASAL